MFIVPQSWIFCYDNFYVIIVMWYFFKFIYKYEKLLNVPTLDVKVIKISFSTSLCLNRLFALEKSLTF